MLVLVSENWQTELTQYKSNINFKARHNFSLRKKMASKYWEKLPV